eukprot:3815948-Rhodomonas_salina.3
MLTQPTDTSVCAACGSGTAKAEVERRRMMEVERRQVMMMELYAGSTCGWKLSNPLREQSVDIVIG